MSEDTAQSAPVSSRGRFCDGVLVGALLLLIVSAGFKRPPVVRDAATGDVVEGARLERLPGESWTPLESFTSLITEFLSRLPEKGLLALVVWIPTTVFLYRFIRYFRKRRQRDGSPGLVRGALDDLLVSVGFYLPLAIFPLPFHWLDMLESEHRRILTPVGLPLTVFLLVAAFVLTRKQYDFGERLRRLRGVGVRFIGALGAVLILIAAIAFSFHGVHGKSLRLVPPPGKLVADLHAHSSIRKDARIDAPERLAIFARHGFDLTVATEHNFFIRRKETDHDYYTMMGLVNEMGTEMRVLPGQEFTTHAFHAVIIGVEETLRPKQYRLENSRERVAVPPTYGYDIPGMIRDVHDRGGHVIVSHWWTLSTYHKVDWELLVEYGVDGFEIFAGADWAPQHLIDSWRDAGMILTCASDFHSYRKSINCWNLIDEDSVEPPEGSLDELNGTTIARRMMNGRRIRPVVASPDFRSVPVLLIPPAMLWHWLRTLTLLDRLVWILVAFGVWAAVSFGPEILRSRRDAKLQQPQPDVSPLGA